VGSPLPAERRLNEVRDTHMNEILRAALAEDDRPVTAKVLRKILREELHTP